MRRSLSLAILASLTALACGSTVEDSGDGGSGGSGAGGSGGSGAGGTGVGGSGALPLAELSAAYGESVCATTFRCCSEAQRVEGLAAFDPPVETEEECRAAYTELLQYFLFTEADRAVTAGTLRYDAVAAETCLTASAAAACGAAEPAVCEQVFVGLVPGGLPCASDMECAGGRACLTTEDGVDVCAAKPAVGESCPGFTCADGAYCDFRQPAAVCAAVQAAGASCDSDDQCASDTCVGATPQTPGTCGTADGCNL